MKLSHDIIKKLKTNAKELNNGAVRLLLFVAMKADDRGIATGIYYKEFCSQTGMCSQSFYNAKRKLVELGFIKEFKNDNKDIDIWIKNNSFVEDNDYKKGYVNLNRKLFKTQEFWKLTDNAVIICLDFLKNTLTASNGSYFKNKKDMYKDYGKEFKVSSGRIWSYLRALKKFFYIGTKDGVLYVTLRKDMKEHNFKSEAEQQRIHSVDVVLRRTYTKADSAAVKELLTFIKQYRIPAEEQAKDIADVLFQCVKHSVAHLKRAEREINCAYIHKLIRRELDLEMA